MKVPGPHSFLLDFIARGISDYLTSETGITIIFESAIVPKWKDSRISFKNVYVSRRPMTTPRRKKVDAHMAAAGLDVGNQTTYQGFGEDEDEEPDILPDEDTNYSMFDLNIDSVDVTLSLWRWLDGRGLVEDAVVKGVRGVLGIRVLGLSIDSQLNKLSQTDAPCSLIQKILLTQPRFVMRVVLGISNLTRYSWKTFSSPSINLVVSDRTWRPSFALISAHSENSGCFMIFCRRRISSASSIIACLACTSLKA